MRAVQKNDMVELTITGMTAQGSGVGHWEGMAVFTPLTAPGDVARVRIVKAAKNFAYGRLEELLVPSPHRVEPDCPCFSQCGGCCYRHITYEEELRIKEGRVRDALERIGGFRGLPLRPILGADSRDGYRNKALLPLGLKKDGSLSLGFYAVNSHRIVDCASCKLQPEDFNRAMEAFRAWAAQYGDPVYDEATHSGRMRRLYLRKGERSGQVLACVVVNGNGLHHEGELVEALKAAVPGLSSVVISSNRDRTNVALGKKCRTVFGSGTILDQLCGLEFQLSPLSFYQVNRTQAERLYHLPRTAARPVLRRGDHRAFYGTQGPQAAGRGDRAGGCGKCPAERPSQPCGKCGVLLRGCCPSCQDAGRSGRASGCDRSGPAPEGLRSGFDPHGGGI